MLKEQFDRNRELPFFLLESNSNLKFIGQRRHKPNQINLRGRQGCIIQQIRFHYRSRIIRCAWNFIEFDRINIFMCQEVVD